MLEVYLMALLVVLVWVSGSLLTVPLTLWKLGRPQPIYRILHLMWMWPFVLVVLFLACMLNLDCENPEEVTRD